MAQEQAAAEQLEWKVAALELAMTELAHPFSYQPILKPLSWPYFTRPPISGNLVLMTGSPLAACCVLLTPLPQASQPSSMPAEV